MLITGIYHLGGVALNKDDSGRAQMQVHFNFEGAASGLYPNQTQFSPLELLIQVNILSDTHQLLTETVDAYVDDRELNGISDPKSGLRLSDLSHLLNTEGKYKISILKEMIIKSGVGSGNAFWYQGFREARLGKLERERDALKRMVTVYNNAMTQFSQQQDPQTQMSTTQTPASPQIYSPQYGNDLVNTLLDLGSKMSDPEYRKELLEAKIKLSAQLQAVITEIEFYQPSTQQRTSALDPEQVGQLISQSNTQVARLNDALIGITKAGNARYLTDKGQLYDHHLCVHC